MMIKIHEKLLDKNDKFTNIYDVTKRGLIKRMVIHNPELTVARWVDVVRKFWNGNLEA
jgi:hypothetical protein